MPEHEFTRDDLAAIAKFSVQYEVLVKTQEVFADKLEAIVNKFADACERLGRIEERMTTQARDNDVIHKRITDAKAEFNCLEKSVEVVSDNIEDLQEATQKNSDLLNKLVIQVNTHSTDHCDDCANNAMLVQIQKDVAELRSEKLQQVRVVITKTWAVNFLEWLDSDILGSKLKYWQLVLILTLCNYGLQAYSHWDTIKSAITFWKAIGT